MSVIFSPGKHLAVSRDIFHCYTKGILLLPNGQRKAKDAAKHLTTHRTAPSQQRINQPKMLIVSKWDPRPKVIYMVL